MVTTAYENIMLSPRLTLEMWTPSQLGLVDSSFSEDLIRQFDNRRSLLHSSQYELSDTASLSDEEEDDDDDEPLVAQQGSSATIAASPSSPPPPPRLILPQTEPEAEEPREENQEDRSATRVDPEDELVSEGPAPPPKDDNRHVTMHQEQQQQQQQQQLPSPPLSFLDSPPATPASPTSPTSLKLPKRKNLLRKSSEFFRQRVSRKSFNVQVQHQHQHQQTTQPPPPPPPAQPMIRHYPPKPLKYASTVHPPSDTIMPDNKHFSLPQQKEDKGKSPVYKDRRRSEPLSTKSRSLFFRNFLSKQS